MSALEYFKYLPKGFLNDGFHSLTVAMKADRTLAFHVLHKLTVAYLKGSNRNFSVCQVSPSMVRLDDG